MMTALTVGLIAMTQTTPAELQLAGDWAAARFAPELARPTGARIEVLANHDAVQVDGRAFGPLRLPGLESQRGLFCHAPSRLVVHLPAPATLFGAVAGVDSNEQTAGARGSVVMSVAVGDDVRWRSDLLREGDPAIAFEVDLDGASTFELRVDDGGDGIACDQADWAEARITLTDGRLLWLSDLPLVPATPVPAEPPYSFALGGRSFRELVGDWSTERSVVELDERRTGFTVTHHDPAGGLVVVCEGVAYRDFPLVEWTVYLRNEGAGESPLIEGLQALDTVWQRPAWPPFEPCEFFLHHWTGSPCRADDYAPHRARLGPGASIRFAPPGGRPSDSDLPYFAFEWPNEGCLMAVGWPGQWSAEFTREGETGLRIRAGQELTRFVLRLGESVRTPRMALLFYRGERLRAHNLWRRWMLAHGYGYPLEPTMFACSSHQYGEMIAADTASQIRFIDQYVDHGLGLDYWWMDAGWYPNQGGWPNTGTWEVDETRFPGGFRPISDHARQRGVKTLVWFEPERVTPGTWLYQRPEWLLGGDGQRLLDLGHDEARRWLTDHVDRLLTEQGIDLYRQDFNMDPLPYWRAADAPDRQGLAENRHVTGYLAYWDELQRRHPGMWIDSCASGGRRNDLETLGRAVPLLRSDYIIEPIGQQGHTYGAAFWYPFMGTGTGAMDRYRLRSAWVASFNACWDMRRDDLPFDELRREMELWRRIAPCFLGDYYPLTAYTLAPDAWIGWQFDLPEQGRGVIQMFRRAESPYELARFRLRGLDREANYRVEDADDPAATRELTGAALMDDGLPMHLRERPQAAVWSYTRLP